MRKHFNRFLWIVSGVIWGFFIIPNLIIPAFADDTPASTRPDIEVYQKVYSADGYIVNASMIISTTNDKINSKRVLHLKHDLLVGFYTIKWCDDLIVPHVTALSRVLVLRNEWLIIKNFSIEKIDTKECDIHD